MPDTSGITYGMLGVSNSSDGAGFAAQNTAGGADLILAGSPPTAVTESGIHRSSFAGVTFNIENPAGGGMSLLVDDAADGERLPELQ